VGQKIIKKYLRLEIIKMEVLFILFLIHNWWNFLQNYREIKLLVIKENQPKENLVKENLVKENIVKENHVKIKNICKKLNCLYILLYKDNIPLWVGVT